jgi:ubiquitin fusion degradation protein 1
MFPAGQNPFGRFIEEYKVYSIKHLQRSGDRDLDFMGKIILPPSALAKLSSLNIEYPMLFEIEHEGNKSNAGVLEFIAEEGRVYAPLWMMKHLQVDDGEIIKIKSVNLQKGTFLKIQPQSVDFLDISDPKAVLENALRQYSALRQGNIISIRYNSKIFDLLCMECKPGNNGISIIETDLSVDFAPPVGYVEPTASTRHTSTVSLL